MESAKPAEVSAVSGPAKVAEFTEKQEVQYQGRSMKLANVSNNASLAEGSPSVSRKPLHEYCVSQLKDVEAVKCELPEKCPDWFEPYRKSVFEPLCKIYNQFVDGKDPMFNTINAFSRNYNDMIISLMKLEKASQAGAFNDEQKSSIAGWLDDVFELFPVNWRELPLVVSPDVAKWKLREEDKKLERTLKANYDEYLKKVNREAFVPSWMSKYVAGVDLGKAYFAYHSIRNEGVNSAKPRISLTAADLYKKDEVFNNWLVDFQDEENVVQKPGFTKLEYLSMRHRFSTVDEGIARIETLQASHKFRWTDLKRSVVPAMAEGLPDGNKDRRVSRSDSSGSCRSEISVALSLTHPDYDYLRSDNGKLIAVRKRSRSSSFDQEGCEQSFEPACKQQTVESSGGESVILPVSGDIPSGSGHVVGGALPSLSGPSPLKITQAALPELSRVRAHLPATPDGCFSIDHKCAVEILVKELPEMLEKYSGSAGGWSKETAENELCFMVSLIDYLDGLNCRQYLDGQRYLIGDSLFKVEAGSRTAYEEQVLSDEQVVWRHAFALLPLKRPLESFIKQLKKPGGKTFATQIKSVTDVLNKQLVSSIR